MASLGLVSPGAVIAAPKHFPDDQMTSFYLFQENLYLSRVFLAHTKNIFIPLKCFNLSYRKLYSFPKIKILEIMILFPHNLFISFLVLVSPLLMVSPGAVRPLFPTSRRHCGNQRHFS